MRPDTTLLLPGEAELRLCRTLAASVHVTVIHVCLLVLPALSAQDEDL